MQEKNYSLGEETLTVNSNDNKNGGDPVGQNKPSKKYHVCQQCGKNYIWKDGHAHKFCSVSCWHEWQKCQKKEKPLKTRPSYQKECAWCGKVFTTPYANKKCCSYECSYEAFKKLKRDKWSQKYIPKTYICRECGTEFTTSCGDTRSDFCCLRCAEKHRRRIEHQSNRHKQYMRKMKKQRENQISRNFVETVSYDRIYSRDKGICQICGLPVIYDKHADINWSGSVDHIIPVSLNGEHSMKNCQLAHRLCNSLKNQSTEQYSINWEEKSKENNYWAIRFKALKEKIGA